MTVTKDDSIMSKVARMGCLYDIYGPLLTPRQREMVELHYFDDWSLAEIAERLGVSRQAVHDHLRRAEEQLEGYEAALGVWAQQMELRRLVARLLREWSVARAFVPAVAQDGMDQAVRALAERFLPEGGET